MTPDDPRHGTTRGYHAGCHEACCRKAMARYEKAGRLARLNGGRAIPAIGAQRRIQALMRLGHTSEDIARAAGWSHRNQVLRILNGQRGRPTTWLERGTHQTICRVYDQLSMRLPEMDRYRRRASTLAERKGWAPPLAWDDIDDPAARPSGTSEPAGRKQYLDHAAIERRINGDRSVRVTADEAREIVRRLYRRGFGAKWIDDNLGIKAERYLKWSEFQSEIGGAA